MIVWILITLAVLYIYYSFVSIRIASKHPLLSLFYSLKDSFNYFRYKKFNICPTGEMTCFTAHFGRGKTLSAVHKVYGLYKRYNDKKVYDESRKKWITQKVHIISNVTFNDLSAYSPLEGIQQIVNEALVNKGIDEENDTRTVILVLIDEASVQLNSRNFKSNIPPDFLNTLLTSRHYHMSFFYTSQKFNLTDKLLRDVTQTVIECRKIWRFQVQYMYDGTELENTANMTMVKPKFKTGFFIRDRDYRRYDTLAIVQNLKKSIDRNDFMSEEEILKLRVGNAPYISNDKHDIKTKYFA